MISRFYQAVYQYHIPSFMSISYKGPGALMYYDNKIRNEVIV